MLHMVTMMMMMVMVTVMLLVITAMVLLLSSPKGSTYLDNRMLSFYDREYHHDVVKYLHNSTHRKRRTPKPQTLNSKPLVS